MNMTTYISILRGINVSGHKPVPMKELQTLYESLGYEQVKTYIQSGNVAFATSEQQQTLVKGNIEKAISQHFGFDVPVLVRTKADVQKVIEENPFLNEKGIELDKLHVTFLDQLPKQENVDKLLTYDYAPDRFVLTGKEVYVYCPNGYGRTKINNTFFESKLKVGATTRNWKTVDVLAEMVGIKKA
ncbi:MAG: DUF1697 domain-containing protein [Imperialibacter sp.]|uniref:DUF1697 domain-containing protein n=1 Tax=Imperialibacter sp. TaxID=2038411 RepID=UPI0032ED33BD